MGALDGLYSTRLSRYGINFKWTGKRTLATTMTGRSWLKGSSHLTV
uniref:Uncharacterized protein n=1 Tax=Mycolicibacterium smegmatis TaxID=1772 RepID=A0A653FH45_MYCSM|nr:hypothetical protein BIN_B_03376 [Mycolicibacterium smegmatis]